MKKLLVIAILLSVHTHSAFSQKEPVKYGKPDSLSLSLTSYNGADAVVLCDYGCYSFDGKLGPVFLYFKRNLRIKILTEEGLKYATQKISYYDLIEASYYPYNQVAEIKAQTLNVQTDGKIVKSKVSPKSIQYSEPDAQYNQVASFTFPDVKVGSIIEYEINIPTIQSVDIPVWYFEHEIPVLHSELRFIAPDGLDYAAKVYGLASPDLFEKTQFVTAINFPTGVLSFQAYQLRFVVYNLPACTIDPYAGFQRKGLKIMLGYASRKYLIPGMEELIKAMEPDYKFKDQAEKINTLKNSGFVLYTTPDMQTLSKEILKNHQFGRALDYGLSMNDSVAKIVTSQSNQTEKMNSILNFVSKHISWDSSFRVFVDPGYSNLVMKIANQFNTTPDMNPAMSKTMKNQTGSNSEINFILINFLRRAGIAAHPVLTSTLENSTLDTSFFNLHQFNHVVVLAEADGNTFLLDAVQTEKGALLFSVPMNDFGLAIRPERAEWISMRNIILSTEESDKELIKKNGN